MSEKSENVGHCVTKLKVMSLMFLLSLKKCFGMNNRGEYLSLGNEWAAVAADAIESWKDNLLAGLT